MRYTNKILKIFIITLVILIATSMVACVGGTESNNAGNNNSGTVIKDKELIAYDHAKKLASEGKWQGASSILSQLGEYKDSAKLYADYERYATIEKSIINAILELKPQLKNPNSFVLYDFAVYSRKTGTVEGAYGLAVELYYGATNSFGGMVQDSYIYFGYVDDKHWEYLKSYEGQQISTWFVRLSKNEMSSMTSSEYRKWSLADHTLYLKTRTDIPENIWND